MPASLEKRSPCKVNLILNILGKRADGFHELETVMHPIDFCDTLEFRTGGPSLELTCSDPGLPVDGRNLAHRAATSFRDTAGITDGVRIHLEKRIPQAAGLGGGSGNAAVTLLGLNELFGHPLSASQLTELATRLGSDVPFFLQNDPALGTGRGEHITPLGSFPVMDRAVFVLVHPGFGISTPWAYQQLARFPSTLNGKPGRAQHLVDVLRTGSLTAAGAEFYNSLEAPALEKFPLLQLFQDCFRAHGAAATLMSGSGSTTFALAADLTTAERMAEAFRQKFGPTHWLALVPAVARP